MKNTPGGINNRLDTTEEKISEFENLALQVIHNEIQRENKNLKITTKR